MASRRFVVLYIVMAFLIIVDVLSVFRVASTPEYAKRASVQTYSTLSLPTERGEILDRNGICLTKDKTCFYALCVPGEENYNSLYECVPYGTQELLYKRRNGTSPFLVRLAENAKTGNLYYAAAKERCGDIPAAEHLIGYTGSDGHGVTGLEAAYDKLLTQSGETPQIQCVTTAGGNLVANLPPTFSVVKGSGFALQTTLDAGIQRVCEAVASREMTSGAIVVMEVGTGEVLAAVSMPQYDQNNIAASLERNDGALIDRTLSQFCVGSVFKPVLAAAAMENGLGWYSVECLGAMDVDGQIYRCAKSIAHGKVNIRKGLEQSCNCFFIKLGETLKGNRILSMAEKLGFGQATKIAQGWNGSEGNLPEPSQLMNTGQLANFSFGQGLLMATPLQIAAMMQAIADDGVYREPVFIKGIADKNGSLVDIPEAGEHRQAMSRSTARLLQSMLTTVVEDGIGKEAATERWTAAGKTGTAQTGRKNAEGEELMDYWFAGFYPAEKPQYAIAILQDNTLQPQISCAALFSRICDQVALLKNVDIK